MSYVAEARAALADAAKAVYPDGAHAGRGIVVCAGGADLLVNAYVLVRVLREHQGCTLPIEIWHAGPEEMPAVMAGILQNLGCRLVDGLTVAEAEGRTISDGWHLKVVALAYSRFREVVMLDADQVPLIDPERIFDWPAYRETGALFWPDVIDLAEENPVWEVVGLAPRRVRSWESGQLCLDKQRHWGPLSVVGAINARADLFYRLIYGDKDSFLLAWLLTGAACSVIPHHPVHDDRYRGQRDPEGQVVFQHRSNSKWSLDAPPARPDGFVLQAECERMLGELLRHWNGRAFQPPPRSAAARRLEAAIAAERWHSLESAGAPAETVELLPHHQVGSGRSPRLANWHVREGSDGPMLVLHGTLGPLVELTRGEDGLWTGARERPRRQEIRLIPLAENASRPRPAVGRTLADDLVDAALAEARAGMLEPGALDAALGLLVSVEPGVAGLLAIRADALAEEEPEFAELLGQAAGRLAERSSRRKIKAVNVPHQMLQPPHYVRPAGFLDDT